MSEGLGRFCWSRTVSWFTHKLGRRGGGVDMTITPGIAMSRRKPVSTVKMIVALEIGEFIVVVSNKRGQLFIGVSIREVFVFFVWKECLFQYTNYPSESFIGVVKIVHEHFRHG